MKISEENAILI